MAHVPRLLCHMNRFLLGVGGGLQFVESRFSGPECCWRPGFQLHLGTSDCAPELPLPHDPFDICLDLLPTAPLPPLQKRDTHHKFLEAQQPTQNPEIPKKHRVYTNFFEEFARTFPYFPVTRVRNPTEIVQKNLFK